MSFELTRREFVLVNMSVGLTALLHLPCRLALTPRERDTLFTVGRTLFPHDNAEAAYQRAVNAVEQRCLADPETFYAVTRGVSRLDAAAVGGFATADRQTRVAVLRPMMRTRFFRVVYAETLDSLYGRPEVWQIFSRRILPT